jgi:hypothetical protein
MTKQKATAKKSEPAIVTGPEDVAHSKQPAPPSTSTRKTSPSGASLRMDVGVFRRMAGAVAHAVPRNIERPLFESLHVMQNDDSLTIEATNGHWFARWRTDHDGAPSEFVIPAERLAAFLKLLPKNDEQLLLFDAQLVTLTSKSMTGPGVVIDYTTPEGEYPDIDGVIPKGTRREGMSFVTLHPEYLASAAKVIETAGGSGVRIQIGAGPDDVSLFFPSANADITGLMIGIMPMRDVEPQE